jgi:mono/diheme cytochrome c family protein
MKRWKALLLALFAVAIAAAIYGAVLIRRGFSATEEPSALEKIVARTVRNLSIPREARNQENPWKATPEILREAREDFTDRCAVCHGNDGSGQTQVGRNLYPKPPDLRAPQTQDLTDGQIRYIIQNGVRLTGMPAWSHPHEAQDDDSWKLVLFIRDLRQLSAGEKSMQQATAASAHYTGSLACEKCHQQIYEHWKKTPMANVVRDPREHPEAIIPDLATNPLAKFTKDQIALVYGSLWK